MDYQEAKRLLHPDTTRDAIWEISDKQESIRKINEACESACDAIDELQEYKQLGTLEEVREAVEKQKAKEPRATNRCYVCPHCGLVTSLRAKRNYCDACGQKILWKVEEWGKKSYQ